MSHNWFELEVSKKLQNINIKQHEFALRRVYCRLCLCSLNIKEGKQLFNNYNSTQTVADVVQDFAKIEIIQEDVYSNLICTGCLEMLTAIKKFKYLIETLDLRLKTELATDPLEIANRRMILKPVQNKIICPDNEMDDNPTEVENIEFCAVVDQTGDEENVVNENQTVEMVEIKQEPVEVDVFEFGDHSDYTMKIPPAPQQPLEADIMVNTTPEVADEKIDIVEVDLNKLINADNKLNASEPIDDPEYQLSKQLLKDGFKCAHCLKVFDNYYSLRLHIYEHIGRYMYCCMYCRQRFISKAKFQKHLRIHVRKVCEKCNKTFKTNLAWESHKFTHRERQPYECKRCFAGFQSEVEYNQHTETAHKSTRLEWFQCKDCNQSFTSASVLESHRLIHLKRLKHKCEQCTELFNTPYKLQVHYKEQHPRETDLCDVSEVVNHWKLKTKQYQCEICKNRFSTVGILQRHKRIHNDKIKRFKCNLCKEKYCFKQTLMRHVKNVHCNKLPKN